MVLVARARRIAGLAAGIGSPRFQLVRRCLDDHAPTGSEDARAGGWIERRASPLNREIERGQRREPQRMPDVRMPNAAPRPTFLSGVAVAGLRRVERGDEARGENLVACFALRRRLVVPPLTRRVGE